MVVHCQKSKVGWSVTGGQEGDGKREETTVETCGPRRWKWLYKHIFEVCVLEPGSCIFLIIHFLFKLYMYGYPY